jgi:hypothetical protein
MPATRQGTGHINWNSFVAANRSGAQRVAGALQQPYQQDMERADAGFRAGEEEFARDVDANTLTYDPNRASGDDGTLRNYSYAGPGSLMANEQFAKGYEDVRHADEGARRLADTYGRMTLLRDFYGPKSPTYTAGQQTFDSALLGGVGQGGFESTRKSAGGLLERFKGAQAASVGTANAARDRSRQAAGQYMAAHNAPPAFGGDQARNPINNTPPPQQTLGDIYTQRNSPDYLNTGDPRLARNRRP